eukprot:3215150-Alexandrium_andersonii.AAC.1
MSASLVGSEMCIRDRAPAGDRPPWPCPRCCRRSSKDGCCCSVADSRAAVSYTHLTLPTICSV